MLKNYNAPVGDQHASANVSVAGAIVGKKVGILSVAGPTLNVFTIVMSQAIDRNNASIKVGNAAGSAVIIGYTLVNDTTIEVRGSNAAGALANAAFYLEVTRKAVS